LNAARKDLLVSIITINLLGIGTIVLSAFPTIAQNLPIPDNTLGNERSTVSPNAVTNGTPSNLIEGGARRGANLFHSFRDFKIDAGRGIYFNNPANVTNIITRVTGPDRSDIFGTLGVLGNANLFLINPNGILFGPNAKLDIRGSFLASTADRVVFQNNVAFSATDPQAPPLLTVNLPIGLQFGANPGSILAQGSNLEVDSGQTLALVGGEVALAGGRLTASGGRIELGSLAADSLVAITLANPGLELNYAGVQQFQDIRLTQATRVATSGDGGGSIQVQGRRLTLTEGARIISLTEGTQTGKDLTIRAVESVEIIGPRSASGFISTLATQALPGSSGNAGNLVIDTGSLRIVAGAQVSASTFGAGRGGDLTVRAQSIELVGPGPVSGIPSGLITQANPGSSGNAGNLTIDTGSLRITNGSRVSAGIFSTGRGGDLTVMAKSVELMGTDVNGFGNTLATQTEAASTGNAGNLKIFADRLHIADGGQVSASTFGAGRGGDLTVQAQLVEVVGTDVSGFFSGLGAQSGFSSGNAGNVEISTGILRIANGAQVSASTSGAGKGGDLTVQAQSVEVIGYDSVDGFSSVLSVQANRRATGNAGNLTIDTGRLRLTDGSEVSTSTFGAGKGGDLTVRAQSVEVSGSNPTDGSSSALNVQTNRRATGNAGNLSIATGSLRLADRGAIKAMSLGTGTAGNIVVQAIEPITLTDNASINSNTNAGQGNIKIITPLLLMRRNSNITTNATGNATGGNISIASDFIVSAPNENNDITTNAFAGSGGQITLTARNIFGFELRSRTDLQRLLNTTNPADLDPGRLPTNDITAFSQANPIIDTGAVTVRTPGINPDQGIITLPSDFTDASQRIAQTCPTGDTIAKPPNQFIITGRGGLPPTPREAIDRDAIQIDLVNVNSDSNSSPRSSLIPTLPNPPIIEAQNLILNADGTISLVAAIPKTIHHSNPCG
jgi:filamentous hemagglutinin family protein